MGKFGSGIEGLTQEGRQAQTGRVANKGRAASVSAEKPKSKSGRRQRLKWTKEARDVVRTYIRDGGGRHKLATALSEMTGNSRRDCLRFARQMGFDNKRFYKRWTEREINALIRLHNINTPRMLAAKLNRPVQSVRIKLARLGITSRVESDHFTKYTLASLLHVRPEFIQDWIDKRLLKAHREGTEKLPRIIIRAKDFIQFCKRHPEVILQHRLNKDTLKFLQQFVFPRDHSDLLKVRDHKKEQVAHLRRRSIGQIEQRDSQNAEPELENPETLLPIVAVPGRSKAARAF